MLTCIGIRQYDDWNLLENAKAKNNEKKDKFLKMWPNLDNLNLGDL